MQADIAIRIRVPFEAEVDVLPEPERVMRDVRGGVTHGLADPRGHEANAARIEDQRRAAAVKAETELVAPLRAAVAELGELVSWQIEEVREAGRT
jgi:hypothetical protein